MSKDNIKIKTEAEIRVMAEGGRILGKIKNELMAKIVEGENAGSIEDLADSLIKQNGAKASFKMVKGYSWATCVNVNDGVVHGIPKKSIIFKKGDVVSVDVGLFYKGFHTDTSISCAIGANSNTKAFLSVGKAALKNAIAAAREGSRIYDISEAMQDTIEKAGYSSIRALVGHGIGRNLHELPQIPCFVAGERKDSPKILSGFVLAIEAMYAQGLPEVIIANDGWTIKTKDGKIAGLFEETVAVTNSGPIVLTS